MGIIVDLIVILIIGLSVLVGYKKGLTKCILKLLTAFIAIIVAVIVYKPVADFFIDNTTIDENIQLSFERIMNNTEGNQSENHELISEDSGIPKPIVQYLNNNVDKNIESKKEEAISVVSRSAALIIVKIACFILLYLLAKIILRILVVLADLVAKLPLIKQFNEIGGLLYGLVEGVFLVLIIMTAVSVFTPLTGAYEVANVILESHVGSFFYNNNIILNIIF